MTPPKLIPLFNEDHLPEVGTLVYVAFSPGKCGKIISFASTTGSDPYYWDANVKWNKKGNPVTKEPVARLRNYRYLLDEHQRKAVNMLLTVRTLEAL